MKILFVFRKLFVTLLFEQASLLKIQKEMPKTSLIAELVLI